MMKGMMDLKNIGIELFKNIIKEAKENPALLDSYSLNQFKSKENLLEHVDMLPLTNPNVVILGSWFGSILVPALANTARHISCIDVDNKVITIAKRRLFTMYNNITWFSRDIWDKTCWPKIREADLIINTSCEHMADMSSLPPLKQSNAYFAFQSNNMYSIQTHINCVSDLNEFIKQLPTKARVLIKDEVEDDRGTRFTLIGKLCAE